MQEKLLDLSPIFSAFEKGFAEECSEEVTRWNNSFRVFHGRGKCFENLDWINIDYHASLILITMYNSSSIILDESLIEYVGKAVSDWVLSCQDTLGVESLLLQRRDLFGAPISALIGEVPERSFAVRDNLKFGLSFGQQNVGYFLDIEPARVWLAERCKGKNLLNLFSYTCAFSVVASGAGASSVVNIDMSKKSLQRGRENYAMNELSTASVKFLSHDIFKSWGKLKKFGPYDMIVIDPPSFQKGSFIASKDYERVIRRMESLVVEGGCFLACLNSPEVRLADFQEMIDANAQGFSFEEKLQPIDSFPEKEDGRELKMLVYRKG